jgi:hypothetical protein
VKFLNRFKHLNVWLAILLIVANVYMWVGVVFAAPPLYVVEAKRDEAVVRLLDHIAEGGHAGEAWEVTLTQLEAEQTITWYLQRYPQIPFAHPRIIIKPAYVSGEGDATIAGLRVHVGGKARITLQDGLPVVTILELSLPLPASIRDAIERELQVQLRRADQLPVRFISAEWRDGEVVVRGVIK